MAASDGAEREVGAVRRRKREYYEHRTRVVGRVRRLTETTGALEGVDAKVVEARIRRLSYGRRLRP